MLQRLITELERVTKQLLEIDKAVAQQALDTHKLMTIPGVSPIVASTALASIGDIARFQSPDKPSSYFGLTPRVRQSGEHPARYGRISKPGNRGAGEAVIDRLGRVVVPGELGAARATTPASSTIRPGARAGAPARKTVALASVGNSIDALDRLGRDRRVAEPREIKELALAVRPATPP
nr:transposase [Bradyrhizobium sp. CCBAU 11434]